jgi:hypothetical protein
MAWPLTPLTVDILFCRTSAVFVIYRDAGVGVPRQRIFSRTDAVADSCQSQENVVARRNEARDALTGIQASDSYGKLGG